MNTSRLIASVNHAVDSLALLRAELARILMLKCEDVSDSRQLEKLLTGRNDIKLSAERFVYFYGLLENKFDQDNVKMINWFRIDNKELKTSPFYAIVDHGRLDLCDKSYQVKML
ncbi:MAG: hypothetical protein KAU21_03900 [Gammaproteobacteria bacterium]|nr:hypothetical protein [Gammaproteobacteria bacterium]